MEMDVERFAQKNVEKWLTGPYDEATKSEVNRLIQSDKKGLFDAFYRDLEFGTGGLRGIMGVGTNRMNIYTVGAATQGLSNYLKRCFPEVEIRVAVSHDSRHHSREFAERTADIFASNGFTVFLFDTLRPTPELSYAIRTLGCQSGVMITASHNPKEYNGYKAYWTDGAQVTEPHDIRIIEEVSKVTSPEQVLTGLHPEKIQILDASFDEKYLDELMKLSLSPESVSRHRDMRIVYSPMHGAGVRLVPAALHRMGFSNVSMVAAQAVLDGDFPTVASPNPEERATMAMAIEQGEREDADIVLATDPDSDRLAVAVPGRDGKFVLLNGNQTLVLLMSYQLTRWAQLGRLDGHQYVVKTIVTSTMADAVAQKFGVKCFDCLTGFKYIAQIIRDLSGERHRNDASWKERRWISVERISPIVLPALEPNLPHFDQKGTSFMSAGSQKWEFVGGGEESFGYLAGDYVRDKDGVSACMLAAEAAAWARDTMNLSLLEWLEQLYVEYGFYLEGLHSVTRPGKEGADEIKALMVEYRANPPREILDSKVVKVNDFLSPDTPKELHSNVLQWYTEDGTRVCVRPSGTEPKIKYYFGVRAELTRVEEYDRVERELSQKIEAIKKALQL